MKLVVAPVFSEKSRLVTSLKTFFFFFILCKKERDEVKKLMRQLYPHKSPDSLSQHQVFIFKIFSALHPTTSLHVRVYLHNAHLQVNRMPT